ncbi:hypothetical protein ILYODFUR_018463 [Ilyodon furcidens]|uniref:Uncharacterized protein n=1 Tax=Ilyodon furcidens TaxID=33524 RepID=A0ABV0UH44_9TELE
MQRNIHTINLRPMPGQTHPFCCPGYPVPFPIHLKELTLYSGTSKQGLHTGLFVQETKQITDPEIKWKSVQWRKMRTKKLNRDKQQENKELKDIWTTLETQNTPLNNASFVCCFLILWFMGSN